MSEAPRTAIDLTVVENLYRNHRYLEAFELSRSYWNSSTDVDRLSIEEIILGCRLAARLGGVRLARWLIRKALDREPSHPRVRYYSRNIMLRGQSLFDKLRADEKQRELCSGNPELDSGWLSHQAMTWASLRDFEHAHWCISRAHAILPGDGTVSSCESVVLGIQDRWPDALTAAELAWQLDPGDFYAAAVLASSLLALGRVEEAAERLNKAAENCQSYELTLNAVWHQCALAETMHEPERHAPLQRALQLADRLPELAPLSDRDTRAQIARTRLELAALINDRTEFEQWAKESRSPFYRQVVENLRKNPLGRCIRLPFRRSKQKYQACLPTSLSAALAAMGCNIDPVEMAAETTYGGTPYWVAADWLEKRGIATRFFPVTPEVAANLVENGFAFILGLESEDFAHAVAVVGLNEAAGTLLIHDPGGFRSTEYLLQSIGWRETPLGPRGMAAFPSERAAEIDRILPAVDSEAITAHMVYHKKLSSGGLAAARAVVEELVARHPDHPSTRFLQAIHALEEGRGSEALPILRDLLAAFPNCGFLRSTFLTACRSLGNLVLLRETLADIVESGSVPGVESQHIWRHPPATYVCNYADLLRTSASSRRKARILLNGVIHRHFSFAEGWRVLADWLWHEQDKEGRALALRIASCLQTPNEYYARAYCDTLGSIRRESEGLNWLEARTRQFQGSPGEAATWATWIAALEYWGRPEEALAAAARALEKCRNAPTLLVFLVPFFARMGVWEQAESALKRLESAGNAALLRAAATDFYDMRGDGATAMQQAEQWVKEAPRSMQARHRWLELITQREGGAPAAKLAAQWVAEHPGHDEFERLYCSQGETRGNPRWKKDMLLYRRVQRNAEDGWAWRELLFRRLSDFSSGSIRRRDKLRPHIDEILRQCDRTAPEEMATLSAHAQWFEAQGKWGEAVTGWLKAIECSPANLYNYRRLWESCACFEETEQRKLFAQVEPLFLAAPGRLSIARDFAFLLAARFGPVFAEECVMRWREQRPEDPDVIQAAADLLLQYGLGVTDATRAAAMLEPAVAQFPHHLGLRFSLAHAQRRTGKDDNAVATLREIARRHPGNTAASIQMAKALEQSGKQEEAQQLMRAAAARNPRSPEIWDLRVQVLARARRFAEARTAIAEGLERLTDGVWWREKAIRMLLECGDNEGAVEVAREGVRLYPHGAYLWHVLALTLKSAAKSAKSGEAETCWRRSVELNPGYFDPADQLAMLLVDQNRFDEAEHLMLSIMPRLTDPSVAKGRLAWIYRKRGKQKEAVDELAWVLQNAPWFRWGWSVIMEWLVEDRSWNRAKTLLAASPAALRNDVNMRRQRLVVLEKAGVPTSQTDQEWNDLLRDFPRDVVLHMLRYDSLREQKRVKESTEVLKHILPLDPNNPWLQARQVEVRVDEGRTKEAIDLLIRIWFAEVETSTWPAQYSWQAVVKAKSEEMVYARARQLVETGSRPTPHALYLMAGHAMELQKKRGRPIWSRWFPPRGVREVLWLLQRMDSMAAGNTSYRGELLGHLTRARYYYAIVGYLRQNPGLVANDIDVWGNAGSTLISLGRRRQAKALLSEWRTRQGVKMWMVVNYVLACPLITRAQIGHVLSTCTDALNGMPHDHCAKYIAHILAETQILLGDIEGFRATATRHAPLFGGTLERHEYFSKRRKYLLTVIPEMAGFLETSQTGKFKWVRLKIRIEEFLANYRRD